ncbi:MAG: hypothetical protein ACFHHU_07505 [Porticoccaceae bacterium]
MSSLAEIGNTSGEPAQSSRVVRNYMRAWSIFIFVSILKMLGDSRESNMNLALNNKKIGGIKCHFLIKLLLVMAVFVAMSIDAAEARREIFGELDAGQVEAAVLTNSQGVSARVIAYGAALQSLLCTR